MAGLFDLLHDVGHSMAPETDDVPNTDVTIVGPGQKYDNTKSVNKVQDALVANPPQGGSDNPGIFGLLPAGVQHGTLRNVLGALGDAFLVGSGRDAEYEPRMQRQEVGNAMAGFQLNPGAAASRVAGTAAPGSADLASKLYDQDQTLQLRRQVQSQNNDYHQSLTANRNDAALNRMTPYIGAMVNDPSIKTPDDYAKAFSRADAMAKRIDPSYSAADFGLIDPTDWQPHSQDNAGATAGQVMHNTTSQDSIGERATAANVAHLDRVRGQNISAAKGSGGGKLPTTALMVSQLMKKQNNNQQLTPAEQAFWDKNTHISGGTSGRALPEGLTVTQPQPQQRGIPGMTSHQSAAQQQYVGKSSGASPGAKANPVVPTTQKQFDNIPKGHWFIDTDGQVVQK